MKISEIAKNGMADAIDLWNTVMPYAPFMGECYHFEQEGLIPERVVLMDGVERLGIYFNGKIWADSDLEPIELNQELLQKWLLEHNYIL